jgi:hypothetical protein
VKSRKDRLNIIVAIVILVFSAYALLHLLMMRYSSGDVYPEYSSMRTDPFGTKAFYESLRDCCDLKVSRNFEEFSKIKNNTNSTIIFAGASFPGDQIPESFFKDLESFMKNGGRLVVTYVPSGFFTEIQKEIKKEQEEKKKSDEKKNPEKKKPEKSPEEDENALIRFVSLSKLWGLKYQEADWDGFRSARLVADLGLPKVLTWHSPVYFELNGKAWNVIYKQDNHAVLVERKFEKGTLVLASETFFISNEAMLRDRHSELLAWLVGPKKEVIFDESHLGIASNPGVASLARKYNLHGLAGGLLVIALLYVWMSGTSLLPAYKTGSDLEKKAIEGKDSASGLSNLLRRNVPPQQIFPLCYSEWKKSSLMQKQLEEKKVKKVEEFIKEHPERTKNPVESYNKISEMLKER